MTRAQNTTLKISYFEDFFGLNILMSIHFVV